MLSLFFCTASVSAQDLGAYQNGDVLIGSRAAGSDLDSSDSPERSLLVTIDTPYQVFDEAGTFIHVASWTPDGTAARGARVYLAGHLIGRTDETGTLAFRWGVPGNDVAAYWLNGNQISVRWDHDGAVYGGDVWFSAFSRTASYAGDHLFIYTDRGVYSPGQQIQIRAIGWHLAADYGPIVGGSVELLLTDPTGRVIAGAGAEPDEFGVVATGFRVPSQSEEGVYELVAHYEGASATARIRIERFTPPVINIEHTLGRFLTRDQDDLSFDVTLGYFTGGEFRAGSLAVDVLVNGASRYHDDLDLSGAGPHSVAITGDSIDAIRAGLAEDQRIEVQLMVVDEFGRGDDLTRELRYTANPYIVIIEKDRDMYSTNDAVELIVRLTDRDRVPVRNTEVRMTTSTGQELTATTDEAGTAQFSLTMPTTTFTVEVFLADVEAPLATAAIPWQERQPMRSHIADAIVEESRPAHVVVNFPSHFVPAESVVHMDVVDISGSLVNAVLIPITHDGTSYVAEGSFTAPSWGSMLLTFFCLGRDDTDTGSYGEDQTALGLMTEGQNLVVHPGRELQIQLDGIPDELTPGARFEGQVTVTDSDGNPVEAAVGAAVVDMAVISLQDPLEITPMDHFYNPELRVISTTGSAILTWPVVSRNWGVRFMDIALPPFPYLAGGPIGVGYGHGYDLMGDQVIAQGTLSLIGSGGSSAPMMMEATPAPEVVAGDYAVHEEAYFEEEAGNDRGRYSRSIEPPPGPVTITIRTEFPETSLWAPSLRAIDGSLSLAGSLPDSVTVQQITIVASDANGGVGVLRRNIRVTQPLFVRSDLPDTLIVGDAIGARVAVQNQTDAAQQVDVAIVSEGLEIADGPTTIEVPANGTAVAVFDIVASRPGEYHFTISARTDGAADVEARTIWVRPRGYPAVSSLSGSLSADAPYVTTVDVPIGGQMTTVSLNVAFPAISAAFAGLDAIRGELASGVMFTGGEIIATALLYERRLLRGESGADVLATQQHLTAMMGDLLTAQRADGGWGLWWDAESNPYATGYSVEALSVLERLDFGVPISSIQNAVHYLATSRGESSYDLSAIAFWEGNTDQVQRALTAEILSILSDVPEATRNTEWTTLVTALAAELEAVLESDTPEIMTLAHTILGLHRLNGAWIVGTDQERLTEAAGRLNTLRRDGHWEPSWFNAYGGTIEATVTVLEVYRALGVELLEADARDLVHYLLSTRDEWGGWHNPRGTASAIRGILILDGGAAEVASNVTVLVNGSEVATVEIDPGDPYLSAMALRQLDLTDIASTGRNTLEVRYNGALQAQVTVVVRHWSDEALLHHQPLELQAELEGSDVQLGGVVDYTLRVESTTSEAGLIRLELSEPANAEFDRASVQSLRERGLVDSVQWTDGGLVLHLTLAGRANRELRFGLVSNRLGRTAGPSVTARVISLANGAPIVLETSTPLAVR
jgi:hypothetical protein